MECCALSIRDLSQVWGFPPTHLPDEHLLTLCYYVPLFYVDYGERLGPEPV